MTSCYHGSKISVVVGLLPSFINRADEMIRQITVASVSPAAWENTLFCLKPTTPRTLTSCPQIYFTNLRLAFY